jgi:signal transduction histidine kinase/CheY-like chemotaxis protein
VDDRKPANFVSISSKFSRFNAALIMWLLLVILLWDIRHQDFNWTKAALLLGVGIFVGGLISRFTIRVLARPLLLLQQGITSVRQGKFQPIQVSATRDEIQYLGESFNRMIEELSVSQEEIRQHRELLEERIRQRTEDLEKAMRTALASSQAKSEFLANMSHELRTPMNGLLGMLDVVLDSQLDDDQKEQLEIAQRSAYSLLALLNDILDLSKIEAGKMMIEKIPYNVRTVLEDCVKSFQARASQKGISLRFEMDPLAPGEVMGDPLRVRQIGANLLSNAVKFTDRGSVSLRLSCAKAAGGWEMNIEVSDTGPGIEADKLSTIFEKFTQADGSITRKYGGTGLGLAIIKRLVEMQGGQVKVESKVGQGSKFTVSLPYQMVEKPSVAAPAETGMAGETKRAPSSARLLLVEDNLVNQKVVMAILRKKGYAIDVANDGREALGKLEAAEQPYDVVLMDIQMPVMDGLETTRVMRRNPRWDHLPIVAMTAHAMNGDKERCFQAGMDSYVSKPVQPAHLIATIEKHLTELNAGRRIPAANDIERGLTDRLIKEDSALALDLLQVFLQLAPERLERLQQAAGQEDTVTLAAEARKIGSAAELLNSHQLSECAQRIEQAAASCDFAAIALEIGNLRGEIHSLEALTAS